MLLRHKTWAVRLGYALLLFKVIVAKMLLKHSVSGILFVAYKSARSQEIVAAAHIEPRAINVDNGVVNIETI
ncbi:MAG: hypothetical protein RR052_06310 [Oscillospiraceae bacterium]